MDFYLTIINLIIIILLFHILDSKKNQEYKFKLIKTLKQTSLLFLYILILFLLLKNTNVLINNKINENKEVLLLTYTFAYLLVNIILSYYDKTDKFIKFIYTKNTWFFASFIIIFTLFEFKNSSNRSSYFSLLVLFYINLFSKFFIIIDKLKN